MKNSCDIAENAMPGLNQLILVSARSEFDTMTHFRLMVAVANANFCLVYTVLLYYGKTSFSSLS